jgi:hypothetical protein
MGLPEVRQQIHGRLRRGGSLAEVEEEIIEPAPCDEDQRAALWLYAWSQSSRRDRGQLRELFVSR